jgi:uncharacterized membrane protein
MVQAETREQKEAQSRLPLKLFLFGFFLIFAGVIVLVVSALLGGDGTVSTGTLIFVGPIPIILGSGPYSFWAIVLAAALTLVGFLVFFWIRRRVVTG